MVQKPMLITVPPSPVARFMVAPPTANVGDCVRFTYLSMGNPISWLWYFGDRGTDTIQTMAQVYQKADTYTVTFRVTNEHGSDTVKMAKDITVSWQDLPF